MKDGAPRGVRRTTASIDAGVGGASGDGGEGGGGGGVSVPVGVYVRREEGLRFEPNIVTLLVVAVPFVWVAGRALTRIIRALKK